MWAIPLNNTTDESKLIFYVDRFNLVLFIENKRRINVHLIARKCNTLRYKINILISILMINPDFYTPNIGFTCLLYTVLTTLEYIDKLEFQMKVLMEFCP